MAVACLCERFLDFAQENLQPGTYESYKYSCQKFIDHFAKRMAHTITTQDLSHFLSKLKLKLGENLVWNRAAVGRPLLSLRGGAGPDSTTALEEGSFPKA